MKYTKQIILSAMLSMSMIACTKSAPSMEQKIADLLKVKSSAITLNEAKTYYTVQGQDTLKVYTPSAEGYEGNVQIIVAADGTTIVNMTVVDASTETPGIGQLVLERSFQEQFIGKTFAELPTSAADWADTGIDMATGATYTSMAVLTAIRSIQN